MLLVKRIYKKLKVNEVIIGLAFSLDKSLLYIKSTKIINPQIIKLIKMLI